MKKLFYALAALLIATSAWADTEVDVDDNGFIDIEFGGTNAGTAANARTSLGLVIGTNVQADLAVPSQAEAEAGSATTERVWTAERIAQAIAALAPAVSDEMVYQADCSTITDGFCVDTDDEVLYYYDGDSVEAVTTGTVDTTGTVNQNEVGVFEDSDTLKALTESEFKELFNIEAGTDVQAYSGLLADIAGITFAQGDVLYFNGTDIVNLGPGIAGQYLKTGGADANPSWDDPAGSGDITAVGDAASGAAFTADGGGNTLYFEGTTANTYEIALTGANPGADVTVTIPAETGTLLTSVSTIDGENIGADTIDDDSIDFGDVTAADITMTDAGQITASGLITGNAGLTVATGQNITLGTNILNSGDLLDGEQIANDTIDDDSIDFADVTLADLTFDVGSVDTTEFGYLNGVTSAIQTQLNAKADIAGAENVSGVWEIQDDTLLNFGNDANFGIRYDETTDDQLEIVSNSASDTEISIQNAGAGDTNLTIDGNITVSGGMSIGSGSGGYIGLNNNSGGRAAGAGEYGLYFETDGSDVLSYSINGSEKRVANLGDAQTISGIKTFTTRQVLQGDADVGDASNAGSLRIYDGSNNYVDLQTEAISTNYNWSFPATYGSNGQALLSDGDGTFTWGSPSAASDTDGGEGAIQYNNGGALDSETGFVWTAASNTLTLGANGQDGSLVLYNESGATDYTLTLQPGTQSGAATVTFPGASGTLMTLGNAETVTGVKTFSAAPVLPANTVDAITEIAAALKSGSDTTLITGTEGDANDILVWDANGDAISSGTAISEVVTAARVGAASANLDDTDASIEWEDAADLESDGSISADAVGTDELSNTLNLVTTGTIQGRVVVETDADGKTMDTGDNATMQLATGAGTWTLPDIDDANGTGWTVCVLSTTAAAVVVDPNAEDTITLDGVTDTAGDSITSASEAGNFVCLMVTSVSSNVANWTVLGRSGTWTAN